MMNTGSRTRSRLAVSATALALPLAFALAACSSSAQTPSATAATTQAAAKSADGTATAAPAAAESKGVAVKGLIAAIAAVAAAAAAGAAWLLVLASGGPSAAHAQLQASRSVPPERKQTAPVVSTGATLVAALDGRTGRYARPGGERTGWIPGKWYGAQSVLPVIGWSPGWVHVRLAQRPNGSTAWIQDSEVELRSTPYRIVIDLATTHLTLYADGKRVFSTAAGVGTVSDPTPAGQYFVAFFEAPPTPAYGPFVIVTSAHSEAISDWEGSGDALIGIHGPLGGDYLIGKDGAKISHGCVRLPDTELLRLRLVPAGTPIDILG